MKLQKTDDQQEMELNMTSMIDVVFLLIIFLMVITDLTQQDLEDLQLPTAQNAEPDKKVKDEWRPIINVKQDGSIWVKRRQLFDPENSDAYVEVRKQLDFMAKKMEHETMAGDRVDAPGPGTIPGEPLLIRADEFSYFKYTQKILEQCGQEGIQIWKLQLAASEAEKNDGE